LATKTDSGATEILSGRGGVAELTGLWLVHFQRKLAPLPRFVDEAIADALQETAPTSFVVQERLTAVASNGASLPFFTDHELPGYSSLPHSHDMASHRLNGSIPLYRYGAVRPAAAFDTNEQLLFGRC
jgi:hypothetical protein